MRSIKVYWKDVAVMLMCFIGALLVALLICVNKLPPPGPDIRVPKDALKYGRFIPFDSPGERWITIDTITSPTQPTTIVHH